jgi:tripartite-type tricarboxylate transporter receptor subunit TctC
MRRVALAAIAASFAAGVSAQTYPAKPIRLIVGFPPGGPNDLIARILAPRMGELLKQPIVVDNRPGANGAIATEAVVKAPPDGYTLNFGSAGTVVLGTAFGVKLAYDPRKDLAPVTLLATNPMLLVTKPGLNAKSVEELIALARANPGKLNYASAGAAGVTHLAAELMRAMARIDVVHVPYKGGGPAMTDLMAGQVDFYFGGLTTALPHARAGKLRALAVTTATRSAAAPEIPTIAESGLPGYDTAIWYGVLAPAGTPREIVDTLHNAIVATVRTPEIRTKLVEQGADPLDLGPDAFAAHIRAELDKWSKVIKEAGIKAE